MEPSTTHDTCRWCGAELFQERTGRPREYCRASHRQRAYEARRLGWRMGLDSGESVVSASGLAALNDLLTVVEAALDDVEGDLRGAPAPEEYRAAFQHLYAAAAGLRGKRLSPRTLGRSRV